MRQGSAAGEVGLLVHLVEAVIPPNKAITSTATAQAPRTSTIIPQVTVIVQAFLAYDRPFGGGGAPLEPICDFPIFAPSLMSTNMRHGALCPPLAQITPTPPSSAANGPGHRPGGSVCSGGKGGACMGEDKRWCPVREDGRSLCVEEKCAWWHETQSTCVIRFLCLLNELPSMQSLLGAMQGDLEILRKRG